MIQIADSNHKSKIVLFFIICQFFESDLSMIWNDSNVYKRPLFPDSVSVFEWLKTEN